MSLAIWDNSVLPATRHHEHTPPQSQPEASTQFTYPMEC